MRGHHNKGVGGEVGVVNEVIFSSMYTGGKTEKWP